MNRSLKNPNIGVASGVVFAAIGFAIFNDNEAAMEALAIATLVVALGVYFALDWRDDRARARRTQRPS